MRARERERFIKMNFNERELEIRDLLYKSRKNAKYKIRITEERYDKNLCYFSDFPEEGRYIDTIYFYTPRQFEYIITLYEGLFYELFDISTEERIGYGYLDPDSPIEEIRCHEGCQCGAVCEFCWFHGMLFDETKSDDNGYVCYLGR